jgi:hypothetical protein
VLRARVAKALDRRFEAIAARIGRLSEAVERAEANQALEVAALTEIQAELRVTRSETAAVQHALTEHSVLIQRVHDRLIGEVSGMLRSLVTEEAENRRRLESVRGRTDYRRPFDEPDPLVSICIPTQPGRLDVLLERALPSALAQTYPSIEVVIVGDGFDPGLDPRVRRLRDPRVRVGDVTHRITDPDPELHWLIGSPLARQEARRLATGLWITDLDDDDALYPDAVEQMLALGRRSGAEVTCGLMEQYEPGNPEPRLIAGFPVGMAPDWSGLGDGWDMRVCTAALWHEGLRSFTRQHVAGVLGVPEDLLLTIRMARAGVRFAKLDQAVYKYYPGTLWSKVSRDPSQRAGDPAGASGAAPAAGC